MKKYSIRKLLALLVALCLLLGGVPVLAEGEPPTVKVTADEENPKDVTADITGDIVGENWAGLNVSIEPERDENGEPTGERASGVGILIDSEGEVHIDEEDQKKIDDADILTVNAGNVDLTTTGSDWSTGVTVWSEWGDVSTTATVGDVTVELTDARKNEEPVEGDDGMDPEDPGEVWKEGRSWGASATAYGEDTSARIDVDGDISVSASTGEESNLDGLFVNGAMSEAGGNNKAAANVEGNVAVETHITGEEAEAGAYGAGANGGDGGFATVYVGGDSISATGTSEGGRVDVTGAYVNSGGDPEGNNAQGTAIGEFDVKEITATASGVEGEVKGVDVNAWDGMGSSEATVDNATISASLDGMGEAAGVRAGVNGEGSESTLYMNGGSASASAEHASQRTEPPENDWENEWVASYGARAITDKGGNANIEIHDAKISAQTVVSGTFVNGDATGVEATANTWYGEDEEIPKEMPVGTASTVVEDTKVTATMNGVGGATGVRAQAENEGNTGSVTVNGGSIAASATLKSNATEPPEDGENKNSGAVGVGVYARNGGAASAGITGTKISAKTNATGADTWADAIGVELRAESYEEGVVQNSATANLENVKIRAEAKGNGNSSGIRAEGRDGNTSALTLNNVDITVVKNNTVGEAAGLEISANDGVMTVDGSGGSIDVKGNTAWNRGISAWTDPNGEVHANISDTDVTATLTGSNDSGEVRGIVLDSRGTTDVDITGNLTVTAEKGKVQDRVSLIGVEVRSHENKKASAQLWVTGDITVTNENKVRKNEWGNADAGVTGANVEANDGSAFLGVIGTITAKNADGDTHGVNVSNGWDGKGGVVNAHVDGSVNVDGGKGYAEGIRVFTGGDSKSTRVEVCGDVTTKGRNENGSTKALQLTTEGRTEILIDGTLSAGGLTPIWIDKGSETQEIWHWVDDEEGGHDEMYEREFTYDPAQALLYVWSIESGEDDQIAVVMDLDKRNAGEDDYDEEGVKAFEESIWYIVRVQDAFASFLSATGTNSEDDRPFDVEAAHQDENVTVELDIDENEYRFDGIYYNGTEKADYTVNADGTYSVKMLRGGAMELGLNLHKHVRGEAVIENAVAPTCTADGKHDEVVYCTECKKELSRATVIDNALGHKGGEAVKEKEVAPTCTADGGYDEVVYCTVCKAEVSRKAVAVPATGHTAGEAVKEKEVAPTCAKEGGYDEVVYCTLCKTELSRTPRIIEKLAHTPGEPVKENVKKATTTSKGSYDEVVYCTVCSAELSREKKTTDKLPAPMPTLKLELVYEPVSDDTAVDGVKASDKLSAVDALAKVGETLDGEKATVTIPGIEKVLDAEEMKRFDKLSVKERLLVALNALGFADDLGESGNELSDDAKALSDDVTKRMEIMDDAQKKALLNTIAELFPKQEITVDGEKYDGFSLDVVVERNGEKAYNRYTFYNKDSEWTLYRIEKGVYREVEA